MVVQDSLAEKTGIGVCQSVAVLELVPHGWQITMAPSIGLCFTAEDSGVKRRFLSAPRWFGDDKMDHELTEEGGPK